MRRRTGRLTRALHMAAFANLLMTGPVLAAEYADSEEPAVAASLNTISVVGTKSPRELGQIAGSVSVIDSQQIQDELIQDIKGLVRFEPGVTVKNDPNRFGLSGFNIRGIEGNRVEVEVDGVPAASGFALGSFSDAGRDYVDPEILKRVEILRGSASGLYGSDAIGGVVSFVTKDPADYLGEARSDQYYNLRAGYNGGDAGSFGTATMAFRHDRSQLLLLGSYRDAQQTETPFPDNPQQQRDKNALFKYVWAPDANQALKFTADISQSDTDSDVVSLVHGPDRFASTSYLHGDDEQNRQRYSLNYDVVTDTAFFNRLRTQIYYQGSSQSQDTIQHLDATSRSPDPTSRLRLFLFDQTLQGIEVVGETAVGEGWRQQQLVYGLEIESTDTTESRDGMLVNLATGATSNEILGEQFPVRDFPLSTTTSYSAFVQDEIPFSNGKVTLVPGLRYDYFVLDASVDQVYMEDNPTTTISDSTMGHLSPRLGLVWSVADGQTIFAQYSQGYRAPPFEDVNIGLTIPLFGYQAIPNPDLEPETSNGLELGWRFSRPGHNVNLAAYYNRYDNFIESRVNLGTDPDTGLLIFQSQNRDEAVIYGLELTSQSRLSDSFSLRMALSWSQGEDTMRNQPLNTVSPPTASVALSYSPSPAWSTSLIMHASAKQDDIDQGSGPKFQPAGYAVFDLNAYFALGDRTRLTAGIFNLADKTYWEWVDVAGLPAGDPLIDIYARPGRHAAMTITYDF